MTGQFNTLPAKYVKVNCSDLKWYNENANPPKIDVECNRDVCENGIIFKITPEYYNVDEECGEYILNVNIEVEAGNGCVHDIHRDRWESHDGKWTNAKNGATWHVSGSSMGNNMIKLTFYFKDNYSIGHEIVTEYWSLPVGESCSGCGNTFNVCDFQQYGHAQPEVNEIAFWSPSGLIILGEYNTYGCMHFLYYMYGADQCGLNGVHNMVRDLNKFLDLAQTGTSGYEDFYGHVTMSWSNIPGNCKEYIVFEDCGIYPWRFRAQQIPFNLSDCTFSGTNTGNYYIFRDQSFPCYDDCVPPELNFQWCDSGFQIMQSGTLSEIDGTDINLICSPSLATTYVNITVDSKDDASIRIQIFDLNGKVFNDRSYSEYYNTTSIDISKYHPGIYIVKATDMNNGEYKTQKIFKQ